MEQIFKGEVYDLVGKTDGLVFSYKMGDADDGEIVVGFKMVSVENGTVTDIAKNVYLIAKYGANYTTALEVCSNYITAKSIMLPNGNVFVCDSSGAAALIDADGVKEWSGELKYRGEAPSDITVYKNGLWASFAAAGVLLRFNFLTMREELRIGGNSATLASPFDSPRDIWLDGGQAAISNAHSKKIVKIDLDSYSVSDFYEFTEAVYGYLESGNYRFALLESGLYSI